MKMFRQIGIDEEDFDFTDVKVGNDYQRNNNFMSHNLRMGILIFLVFVIGGLQALKLYSVPFAPAIDAVTGVLMFIEHSFFGNTTQ